MSLVILGHALGDVGQVVDPHSTIPDNGIFVMRYDSLLHLCYLSCYEQSGSAESGIASDPNTIPVCAIYKAIGDLYLLAGR